MPDHQDRRLPISSSRLIIDGEDIPFGAYQALYHRITRKTEKLSQAYPDAYEIDIDNISELNQRLEQCLKQYRIAGKHCEISHSLSGGQSRQFSAFEKFSMCDVSVSSVTRSVNYELNFLIILPAEIPEAEDIPQRYKISINFESQDAPEEDEESRIARFIRITHSKSINLYLDYADYTVAISIKSIVDGWINTLPVQKRSFLQNRIIKDRFGVSDTIADVVSFIPYVTAIIFILEAKVLDIKLAVLVMISATLFARIDYFLISLFWNMVERAVEELLPLTRILITKGDKDRKILAQGRKRYIAWLISGIFGIIMALAVNLASSYIYAALI
jgi:hypothetical protein